MFTGFKNWFDMTNRESGVIMKKKKQNTTQFSSENVMYRRWGVQTSEHKEIERKKVTLNAQKTFELGIQLCSLCMSRYWAPYSKAIHDENESWLRIKDKKKSYAGFQKAIHPKRINLK